MTAPTRYGQYLVFATPEDRDRPATRNSFEVDQWEPGALTYIESTDTFEKYDGTDWVNITTGPNFAVLEAGAPDPQAGDHLPNTLVFRKLV